MQLDLDWTEPDLLFRECSENGEDRTEEPEMNLTGRISAVVPYIVRGVSLADTSPGKLQY